MRILYVLTSLGIGGAEKQTLAVAERMKRRGHVVALLVLMPPLTEQWPTSLPILYLGITRTPASIWAGLKLARRFVRAFQPDVVHSHSFPANIFARLLHLLVPRLVVLSTIHNVYEGGWHRMLAYRLTDPLSRRTVAVSEAAASRFVHLLAISRRKCSVVPNGIDVDEFAPDVQRRAETREKTRAEKDVFTRAGDPEFVWLAVGRMTAAKDYPNLLEAFAVVHARRSDARLWIAGDAAMGQIAAFQDLRKELGIDHVVRWLGLRRDIPALLDAADAFVLSSAWEGMPLAVGEAMAMEKPVVATDVGGVRELVGAAGVMVTAKNSRALAEAMLTLMEKSKEERAKLGREARDRILRFFSMNAAVDAWEAMYRQFDSGQ